MTTPSTDILVVDDNPNQLTALRVILTELGANVVCVTSGRDALRRLLHQDFAAILLDVNMPTMDGFETAHLIRQRQRSEHTPIIFITAFADETHVARGYSLGAVDYIHTPVVPEILRAKVSVFIELYRKSVEVRRQADSLRRRADQLHGLTEASLAIHDAPTIEKMLPIVVARARATLDAGFAAARLRLPDGRAFEADARESDVGPTETGEDVPSEHAIREALNRVADGAVRIARPGHGGGLPGWVGVPLATREGAPLGSLLVAGRRGGDFGEDDTAILLQLAQMASIAVENTLFTEEREANRLKDEFLATVSHELRTPLTAMLSWVRLLQGGALDDGERTHALEVIDRNARAQSRLVDDLLDMSRIVTGKLQLAREHVDFAEIVTQTIDSIRPAAAAKSIELRVAATDHGIVDGDAKRLQQVMWNLLSNAVKFTPREGYIDVTLRCDGEAAELRITDTGRGINPAFLPHVFDRFRQADTSTTRSHGGLGLGLAIVRYLVELHGGTVAAESAGDECGATFVVRLPLVAAVEAVDGPALRADGDGAGVALDGLRILVVEDDADSRDALAILLTNGGAQVVAVGSVRAALTAIEDAVPDVVVSDIGLPTEDGYALIRKLRMLPPESGGQVPAIALTAYTRAKDRAHALAAGYTAHVCKPVDPQELLTAVAATAPSRRSQQHAV